jgi:dihydroorotase
MSLVHTNGLDLSLILRGLTSAPAAFIDRPELGNLKRGTPADITVFDPNQEWEVDSSEFLSRGKNTPLQGQILKGRVVITMVGGKIKYSSGSIKNI